MWARGRRVLVMTHLGSVPRYAASPAHDKNEFRRRWEGKFGEDLDPNLWDLGEIHIRRDDAANKASSEPFFGLC